MLENEEDLIVDNIVEKIIDQMEELGKKGFIVGDAVMFTEPAFYTLEDKLGSEFIDELYKHKMYITDIDEKEIIVKTEDYAYALQFRADTINDFLILVYRMDSGIPNAEKYCRENQID